LQQQKSTHHGPTNTMNDSSRALIGGAYASFAVAAGHLLAVLAGPAAYDFLEAPQLGRMEAAGSWVPDLITIPLAAVFALFGWYALSLAGRVRPLPLARPGVISIGSVYTLRGLVVVAELTMLARGVTLPFRFAGFSLISLAIGCAYLAGGIAARPVLGSAPR
jgi:hypothetical protein